MATQHDPDLVRLNEVNGNLIGLGRRAVTLA